MKIKLTQSGYENMTGLLGTIPFTNGVSDDSMTREAAAGIANIVQCDIIEGDIDLGQDDVTDPTVSVSDADETAVADDAGSQAPAAA